MKIIETLVVGLVVISIIVLSASIFRFVDAYINQLQKPAPIQFTCKVAEFPLMVSQFSNGDKCYVYKNIQDCIFKNGGRELRLMQSADVDKWKRDIARIDPNKL